MVRVCISANAHSQGYINGAYSDEDEVPAGNENKDLRCVLKRRRKTFNSQYAVSGEFKEICFLCRRRSQQAMQCETRTLNRVRFSSACCRMVTSKKYFSSREGGKSIFLENEVLHAHSLARRVAFHFDLLNEK